MKSLRGGVSALMALVAVQLTGCGSTHSSDAVAHQLGAFKVMVTTETLVDHSRSTPANGKYRGSPVRTLPTLVFIPVRPAGDQQRLPLVVFSPGYSATPSYYSSLLDSWASAGYVIAAVHFPLSSGDSPGGPTLNDFLNQPGDVKFVISQMMTLSSQPDNPLSGLLDPYGVAVAGHSLGAVTTLALTANTCCRDQDPHIRAAISLSGYAFPFPGGRYFPTGGHYPPMLDINGTADQLAPVAQAQALFKMTPEPKYQALMLGAPHVDFSTPWGPVINRTVVAFLNKYLARTGSAQTILQVASVPGVSVARS